MPFTTIEADIEKGAYSTPIPLPAYCRYVVPLAATISGQPDPLRDPNSFLGFLREKGGAIAIHVPAPNVLAYGAQGVPVPASLTHLVWRNGLGGKVRICFLLRTEPPTT